jgi:ATP-dependent helicase/nuclease subunit A
LTKLVNRPSFLQLSKASSFLDLLLPLMAAASNPFASRIWTANELLAETVSDMISQNQRRDALLANIGGDVLNPASIQLSARLASPYPHANLANLYAKTTVSELKRSALAALENTDDTGDAFTQALYETPPVTPYIPRFIQEEGLDVPGSASPTATARGSAYHRIMESLDFKILIDAPLPSLEAQLERHLRTGRLTPEERGAVDLEQILAFCRTPLAARMVAADREGQLYREQPFVIGVAANRLNPDFPSEEIILIQGIIDSFFAEEDGLVVIDYKSDAAKTGAELVERYQKQLNYYQEALEQLTGQPVKEKLIYSFVLKETIKI